MRPRKLNQQKRNRIISLREEGETLKSIAKSSRVSVSTVTRVLRENPKKEEETKAFPYYANAKVFKEVPNPRLVWVVFEEDKVTKLAIKRSDLNYRRGSQVTVEVIDENTQRIV